MKAAAIDTAAASFRIYRNPAQIALEWVLPGANLDNKDTGTDSKRHSRRETTIMPFIADLKRIRNEMRAQTTQPSEPWRLRLERARGKIGDDGVERVSTQSLFDLLEVPQRGRNAGAARRLAKIMRELGWAPIKARGITPGGFTDQVRGYARTKSNAVMR
jgi:hypothetical protein